MSARGGRAQRRMARLAHPRDRGARPQGHAERRQFPPHPFPEDAGRTAQEADAFLSGRGLILRRVEAYGLPHALRLTVGDEEANRLVVAALRDFLDRRPPCLSVSVLPARRRSSSGVALIGFGLIGSSIARAARHLNLARTIVAIDRDAAVLARVRELGIADETTTDAAGGVAGATSSSCACRSAPAARWPRP